MLSIPLILLSTVFGAIVGSFVNVVVYRVPRGESVVRPASRCPNCGEAVRARDNIPVVSWVLLRGSCRSCSSKISFRYPVVECLTATLFALIAWRIGMRWEVLAFFYLAAVGVALSFIDLDVRRLPDALTLPSYVVGTVLLTAAAVAEHEPHRLLEAAVGMAALYLLYFALMIAKPGGMGFGDVKLAGVLGMFLGFLGWGPLAVGAFLAFLLGGFGGVALMLVGRAGRKTRVPFGPYMIAGALIAVFVGSALAHAYTQTFVG